MLEAEYLPNPYPLYHQLREADPVFWDEEENHWLITSHAEAMTGLRGSRFSAQRMNIETGWILVEKPAALLVVEKTFGIC
jgi:cytochrome P450